MMDIVQRIVGDWWMALLSASVMVVVTGLIAMPLVQRLSANAWRARGWITLVILFQGLMLVRMPFHLGWLDHPTSRSAAAGVSTPSHEQTLRSARSELTEQPLTSLLDASQPTSAAPSWYVLDTVRSRRVAIGVWLTVISILFVRACYRYFCTIRWIRKLSPAPRDWDRSWQQIQTSSRRVEMLVSRSVGPLVLRCPTRSVFVVPQEFWSKLTETQRRGVMLHEHAHLKRGDIWRQLVCRVITSLHWFNPMAWWALRQYEKSVEFACDDYVAQDGPESATGFAAALVELIQWDQQNDRTPHRSTGLAYQAMAAPPLTARVSHLLQPPMSGDSIMKRVTVAVILVTFCGLSVVQLRLSKAQSAADGTSVTEPQTLNVDFRQQLAGIGDQLDTSDPNTAELNSLLNDPNGQLVIMAYIRQLQQSAKEALRDDAALPFMEHHFKQAANGQYSLREAHQSSLVRWKTRAKRLTVSLQQMRETMDDMGSRLDGSSETGGLLKRLMQDRQASAAILLFEMKGDGDVIAGHLEEMLADVLVKDEDGYLQVVPSRRNRLSDQIGQFESATAISERVGRALTGLAKEFATDDAKHRELVDYLNHPLTAVVASMILAKDQTLTPASAAEKLVANFEQMSVDTSQGLRIEQDVAWEELERIYDHVDRAEESLEHVRSRLLEVANTLSTKDELVERFAAQLKELPLAVQLTADLPASSQLHSGDELRGLLSEVLYEEDGKLFIDEEHESEVHQKVTQLLQVCRAIRRHLPEVDSMVKRTVGVEDLTSMGDAARYVLLAEVRDYVENHRPDPLDEFRRDLLSSLDSGLLRVRNDRREVMGRLTEQLQKMNRDQANDDF